MCSSTCSKFLGNDFFPGAVTNFVTNDCLYLNGVTFFNETREPAGITVSKSIEGGDPIMRYPTGKMINLIRHWQ